MDYIRIIKRQHIAFHERGATVKDVHKSRDQLLKELELLGESERKYRTYVNQSTDGFFVVDGHGRCIDVNPASCNMLGYTKEDLLKITFTDTLYPEVKNILAGLYHFEKTVKVGGSRGEFSLRKKDGSKIIVDNHSVALGGNRYLSILRDVTGRKEMEQELGEYRAQLEQMVEERTRKLTQANDLLHREISQRKQVEEELRLALAEAQQRQAEISAIRECTCSVLEYPEFKDVARSIYESCKNLLGATSGYVSLLSADSKNNEILFLDLGGVHCAVNPDLPMPIRGLRAEAYRTGKAAYENNYSTSQWQSFMPPGHAKLDNVLFAPFTIEGKTLGLMGMANKAGGFTEADAQVASAFGRLIAIALANDRIIKSQMKTEELFARVFKSSPVAKSINLPEDFRLLNVNDSYSRMTGYTMGESIGRTPAELNLWVDMEDPARIRQLLHNEGAVRNQPFNFRMKSGETREGLLSLEPIMVAGEQLILMTVNDVTEHKQYEREMARLERLSLVGEMAAGIGHEIRNPMTTVRGLLQLLGEKAECIKYKEYYDLMISELDRANAIITEFLSLAKNNPVYSSKQNLNQIVEAIHPLLVADAMVQDKYIILELNEVPALLLDQKQIRQLILNLACNGLEAMSPGGKLTIKTYLHGGDVVMAVQDQGAGIEPGLLEKLGTPFLTTKEKGTGLGLAICYGIAERHGAVVEVKSSPRGTTFYVRFKPAVD